MTYGTLCHAIGHQVLPTITLPREVEDLCRGDRFFEHVSPLTYVIYLSPKKSYAQDLFKCYGYLAMKYNVSYEN